MGWALEMTLDSEACSMVERMRKAISSPGDECLTTQLGAEPHISLAVFDDATDPGALQILTARWAARIGRPQPFLLSSLGVFPDAGVVFVAPKPDPDLLRLHAELIGGIGLLGEKLWELYRPRAWVPHCTVELALARDQLGAAVTACAQQFTPMRATATALTLVRFRPVEVIARFPLGSR